MKYTTKNKQGLVAAPSRFSIRRKIRSANTNAARNRKPCLRISRTVEQINQSKDEWRENTSKLMYIVALGLTPTEGWKGLPKPVIEVSQANAAFIEKIQERFQLKRLKKLETVRQKRQSRFSRHQKYAKPARTGCVSPSRSTDSNYSSESSCPELIDLVSEEDDDTSAPQVISKLSDSIGPARNVPSPRKSLSASDNEMYNNEKTLDISRKSPQWPLPKTVEVVDLVSDEESKKCHTIPGYRNISITMAK